MAGTDPESCSVMQWGINFTGLSLQLVRKSATASRSGLAMGNLGRLQGRRSEGGAKPNQVIYEKINICCFILSDIKCVSS